MTHSRKSSHMQVDEKQIKSPQVGLKKELTYQPQTQAQILSEPLITLGSSKLSDYRKLSMLGKGTYGEVYKCVHNPTGQVVAMKTFLFEVSIPSLFA